LFEKYTLCSCRVCRPLDPRLDTKKITAFLLKNLDIKSLFNSFSGDLSLPLNAELKDNLLEKLISLYLRVRAFSTARDMIEKHRDLQKKNIKSKA